MSLIPPNIRLLATVATRLVRGILGLLVLLPLLGLLAGCSRDDPKLWKRVDGVWTYDGRTFEAADAATLKPLDGRFARDSVQGYYRGTPVPGSHGPSFEVLGENEARDQQAVYWADTYRKGQDYYTVRYNRVATITGADPARYQVLRHSYGRDGKNAYREGLRLRGVRDVATFEVLSPRLTRDAQRAYFHDIEIPDSDGASFEIIDSQDDSWVRDRQRAWHLRHPSPASADPPRPEVRLLEKAQAASVRPLGRGYATDGQRVWWRGEAVKDASAATFTVIQEATGDDATAADAQDGLGTFAKGRRLARTTS